jgi:NADH-quinone oxidoreductase subunit L
MFRLFFIVFYGKAQSGQKLEPLPGTMTKPLVVLAVGSAFAGLLGVNAAYGGSDWFRHFIALPDRSEHLSHAAEYLLGTLNVAMAAIGIWLAYRKFVLKAPVEPMAATGWQKLVIEKFYIDELYEALFVKPLHLMSRFSDRVIDKLLVDGLIGLSVFGYRYAGTRFAQLQNGKVRYYALYILIGVSVMSLFILDVLEGL